MHKLCLITVVALAQVAHGQDNVDAPTDGVLAEFAPRLTTDGPTGRHDNQPAAPSREASPFPNVAQQLGHETYVMPASATEPLVDTTDGTPNTLPDRQPLRLSQRTEGGTGAGNGSKSPVSLSGTIVRIVSSLAIVLGLFFLLTWFLRRGAAGAGGALPSDVVQVLGRSQLSNKQQLQLIRIGEKLVLIAVSPSGSQPLTEVTNAAEVERLATACEGTRGGSASESFRQVLSQLGNQPAIGGFFGGDPPGVDQRRSRRAEESHA